MDSIKCASQFVEAYNSRDWDRLKESFAADGVYDEVGTRRRLQGPDEILRANQGWEQAFPDSQGSITSAFANGDDVMLVDRGSTCGTIVEGTVIGGEGRGGSVALKDGDVIIVGTSLSPFVFKVRLG